MYTSQIRFGLSNRSSGCRNQVDFGNSSIQNWPRLGVQPSKWRGKMFSECTMSMTWWRSRYSGLFYRFGLVCTIKGSRDMIAFINQTCVSQVICTRNEGAREPANVFNRKQNSYDYPDCTEVEKIPPCCLQHICPHTCRTRMKESLVIYADDPSVAFQ